MARMLNGVLIAAAVYAALLALAFWGQRAMMYFPGPPPPSPAHAGAPDMTVATLQTEDGLSLQAWYVAPTPGNAVVVLFHGNAGNIAMRVSKTAPLRAAGVGVLLVEYRGYGGNAGSPSEQGLYADGRAAMAFVASRSIAPARVVLYGESLGGGVAVRLAHEAAARGAPVGGLVLEGTFSAATDVAQHHYPYLLARWLLRDRYPSRDLIANVGTPLFMAHGDHDQIVPMKFARRLFESAREPKTLLVVDGGGHNDLQDRGVPEAVLGFLESQGLASRSTD